MGKKRASATRTKSQTLGWLAELYFSKGASAARQAFREILPTGYDSLVAVSRRSQARTSSKSGGADDAMGENFSAPALWDPPYSLSQLQLAARRDKNFRFHIGEEFLVPVKGQVCCQFFRPPETKAVPRENPVSVKPGSILRINPQIPHRFWAMKTEAQAWMIARRGSASFTSVDKESSLESVQAASRGVSIEALSDPGRYALVAWGLAEAIRCRRIRADVPISHLAAQVGIDASHLSRIESADVNVSLHTLLRIAEVLQIDLLERIAPEEWTHRVIRLPKLRPIKKPRQAVFMPLDEPEIPVQGRLRLSICEVSLGFEGQVRPATSLSTTGMSSWIILRGAVLVDVGKPARSQVDYIQEGDVIHFRGVVPSSVKGMKESEILAVACLSNREIEPPLGG